MLGTTTWMVIVSTCGIAGLAQVRSRAPLVSFITLVNVIYLIAVLPKSLLYNIHGTVVFLTATAPLSASQVNAAVMVASLFVAGVNLGWLIIKPYSARLADVSNCSTTRGLTQKTLQGVDRFTATIGLPSAILACSILIYGIHVSGGQLMQKLISYPTDDNQLVYIAQKAAQGAKCVVYLYLTKLLIEGWPLSARANLLFSTCIALTLFAFIAVGQRSGILLLFLQFAYLLQVRKSLSPRTILIGIGVFAILSMLILMMRETTENTGFVLVNLTRRYFFEIEKLAGIAMLIETSGAAIGSLWDLMIQISDVAIPAGNLHVYLGQEVLGSTSAVPPTIVGEAWLFIGAASILPLGLLLGSATCLTEKVLYGTNEPILIVVAATVLALASFFLLNTDTLSFFRRLIQELVLISAGWVGLVLFNRICRVVRGSRTKDGQ